MFKREKIILGLILKAKYPPGRTELMKLSFLLKQNASFNSNNTFYDFLPYKFGPYSFTLDRDLNELARSGYINPGDLVVEADLQDEANKEYMALNTEIQDAITETVANFAGMTLKHLLDFVYERYPWFASRSELTSRSRPNADNGNASVVYTKGYEGESIDYFLNRLLRAGIVCLIDVRFNPVSRKYGFSKKTIASLCGKLDINYVHLPELGIPPSSRKTLDSFEDYQELLDTYEKTILPEAADFLSEAENLIVDKPSALLCFEADVECCHRGRVAKAISIRTGMEVVNL